MVASEKLFGIRIENLEKLGKNEVRDWKSSVVPAPFDFSLNLPGRRLRHFVFESKLFLAGGTDNATKIYQISCVGDDRLKLANAEESGIPKPPTPIDLCYFANIQGDVYLVVHDDLKELRKAGLWVLRSRSRSQIWEPLSCPPTAVPPPNWGFLTYRDWIGFTLNDKLFLQVERDPLQPITGKVDRFPYVYNPQKGCWSQVDSPFSFSDLHFYNALVPVSSLGDVGNCSVALTWEVRRDPPISSSRVKYDIHALLVDNKDYCVGGHQRLNELCEGIQPSFFEGLFSQINIVDLGNSKVCIIITGNIFDDLGDEISVICMSVAELELVQEEEQKFLSVVRVLVNQVYGMIPHIEDCRVEVIHASFVSSLIKHPCPEDSISPMKQRKLASGTNPSNPTTPLEQQ